MGEGLRRLLAQARGGRLSVSERRAAEVLCARFKEPGRLRAALCSLLARSPQEYRDLALLFDEHIAGTPGAPRERKGSAATPLRVSASAASGSWGEGLGAVLASGGAGTAFGALGAVASAPPDAVQGRHVLPRGAVLLGFAALSLLALLWVWSAMLRQPEVGADIRSPPTNDGRTLQTPPVRVESRDALLKSRDALLKSRGALLNHGKALVKRGKALVKRKKALVKSSRDRREIERKVIRYRRKARKIEDELRKIEDELQKNEDLLLKTMTAQVPHYRIADLPGATPRQWPLPMPVPCGALALALALLTLGLRLCRLPSLLERLRRDTRRRRAEHGVRVHGMLKDAIAQHQRRLEAGGGLLKFYDVPLHLPVPRAVLEDCALYLGRVYRSEHSVDLDIHATLNATLQMGLPEPRFLQSRAARSLLVLYDSERGDSPDLPAFLRVLDGWERLGVTVERLRFSFNPLLLESPHGGPLFNLRDVARQHADSPLVLFSRRRGAGPRDAAFADELRAFSLRAWIDPDPLPSPPDKSRAIARLRRAGLPRFPFTREGLLGVARYFAAEGAGSPPPFPVLPRVDGGLLRRLLGPKRDLCPPEQSTAHALQRWALAAALVPDPSWDQLEDLRQRFRVIRDGCPERWYVHLLLDLFERTSGVAIEHPRGDRLAMPFDLESALVDSAEALAPDLVREVDKLLLKQLEVPPCTQEEDGFDYAHWQLKRARHQARQGELASVEAVYDSPLGADAEPLLKIAAIRAMAPAKELRRVHLRLAEPEGLTYEEIFGIHKAQWGALLLAALLYCGLFLTLRPETLGQASADRQAIADHPKDPISIATPQSPERARPGEPVAQGPSEVAPPGRDPHPPSDSVHLELVPSEQGGRTGDSSMDQDAGLRVPTVDQDVVTAPGPPCDTCKPAMKRIPGGTFQMGSLPYRDQPYDDDESPQHAVTLSAFYLAETEVTQGQYEAVLGVEGNRSSNQGHRRDPAGAVTWFDAVRYCNALSVREGLQVCYQLEGDRVTWLSGPCGYRLPTEAEWEYAARGNEPYQFAGSDNLDDVAWHGGNSGYKAHQVGGKKRNGFQLYDMSGNVWEWVWDWHGHYLEDNPTNPRGPDSGQDRVRRGGSWGDVNRFAQVTYRALLAPSFRDAQVGFRVARSVH